MVEYISGEKHREMVANRSSNSTLPKPFLVGIVTVILLGLSFYGGVAYQKSRQPKVMTATAATGGLSGSSFAGGARRFGGQRPTIGQVTAVSASSITVQDSSSGSSKTLSITSSTQVTNNGQTVTAGSIQVGDNVLAVASTGDETQAARILVNPSFGGGGSSQSSSGGSTGTSANGSGSTVTN
jgi:hypothetical protein